MTLRTRFTRTAVSTVAVALCIASQPATAEASDPDPVLTAGLEVLAKVFGNSVGQIVTRNDAGAMVVLARYLGSYLPYTAGDAIAVDDTLAFCQQDVSGGLVACVDLSAPDPTAYECDWDDEWSWCTCEGPSDCVTMLREVCDDDLECGDVGICVCSA